MHFKKHNINTISYISRKDNIQLEYISKLFNQIILNL